LILLPGLDGTGLLFQPFVPALPAWMKPKVVNYPCDRHLTYQELLPLVLDALPQNEPFILLGESFSGPLAAMVAARRPAGLVGLVLCATFVTRPWPFVAPAVGMVARAPVLHLLLPFKKVRARLGGYATPQRRALMAELNKLLRPHVMASRLRMVFAVDAREALRSCNVPLLYIRATRDIVVPGGNLRVIRRIHPSVQVAEIATSHMVLQREPAQAAAAIEAFALSLGKAGQRSSSGGYEKA
jgi:pimeloyl-ACP methyl ester carboxylesterase